MKDLLRLQQKSKFEMIMDIMLMLVLFCVLVVFGLKIRNVYLIILWNLVWAIAFAAFKCWVYEFSKKQRKYVGIWIRGMITSNFTILDMDGIVKKVKGNSNWFQRLIYSKFVIENIADEEYFLHADEIQNNFIQKCKILRVNNQIIKKCQDNELNTLFDFFVYKQKVLNHPLFTFVDNEEDRIGLEMVE